MAFPLSALALAILPAASGRSFLFPTTAEPPCRQLRLEPFRQSIRDACPISTCVSYDDDIVSIFPTSDLNLLRSLSLESAPSSSDNSLENVFDDIMSRSLNMFDAMLSIDGVHREAEEAAEQALDVMLTSLFSSMDNTQQYDTTASRLNELGNDYLLSSHRRLLSEEDRNGHKGSSSSEDSSYMKERLARRLSEYISVMYLPDDSSKTVFTTSFTPINDHTPPILGMGSRQLDNCIYSKYTNGDILNNSCKSAVDMFMEAHQTPGLTYRDAMAKNKKMGEELMGNKLQGATAAITSFEEFLRRENESYTILLVIYALVALLGMCTGLIDITTFVVGSLVSLSVVVVGLWSLLIVVPAVFVVERLFGGEEEEECGEEEEGEEDAYDYVKLNDDDGGKEAEPLVFVGVPVQVV